MTSSRTMSVGVALAAATAAAAPVVLAAPAAASGTEVIAQGRCSVQGTWKLKARHDDGRLETEFEVDVTVRARAVVRGSNVCAGSVSL